MKKRLAFAMPALLMLCACAQQRVVLLPAPDGKVGAVEVSSATGHQRVDTAYGGVAVSQQGQISSFTTDPASVERQYGALLAARPPRPVSFIVHFQSGSSTEFTPDSAAVVQQILQELGRRAAPELIVTGYTDAVGTDDLNDHLSLQRAQTVVEFLSHHGIAASQMQAVGRGKRDPAVQTANAVAEQANRRVEVTIR
ncbi:MAG: OmpA family protein [Pelomonas sp.]|nr:OmpA family protein [Burkholderiaceae bacterium]MBV8605045.1 OmpA family protein [Roseateles sp.]